MTKAEQKRLLRAHLRAVCAEIMASVVDMPEDWDGFELRWFAARAFDGAQVEPISGTGRLAGRRRAFNKIAPDVETEMRLRMQAARR